MRIKVAFCDFWDDFNPQNNFILDSLRRICDVEVIAPNEHPDFLFYSIMGYSNLHYTDCVRIYYTGENDIPDFNKCDYAISFHHFEFGHRHLRLPIYTWYGSFNRIRDNQLKPIPTERGFCSYVVSNNWCATALRTDIFEQLSQYKPVASGGRYANNVGGPVKDKIEFLRNYKFNIAFENSSVDGYTTEKLLDALAARTVPIYWGNPRVNEDVNPRCFINVSDFSTLDECIAYIKKVDTDDALYSAYLAENPFREDHLYLNWENSLDEFLRYIITNSRRYVTTFGLGGKIFTSALGKEEMFHSNMMQRILKAYKRLRRRSQC